ncbi:MAG TPA: hypothetical protein VMF52_18615 [Steroidobacteraceae bacterium]|nr:hypothetical protein [Steroidobacteraceae bacterium]
MSWRPVFTKSSNHRAAAAGLCALAAVLAAAPARATEAIVLEAREVTVAGITVHDASVRLDLLSDKQTRLSVRAADAVLPDPVGRLTGLALVCDRPVVAEPRFGCDDGRFTGRGGPTGAIDTRVKMEMNTASGVSRFSGSGLKIAGTTATFDGSLDARGWTATARTGAAKIPALVAFAKPWFALPADFTVDGDAVIEGTVADRGQGVVADVVARLSNAQFTNEAGDIVGEKLAFTAKAKLSPREKDTGLELDIAGDAGQAFLSVIFFDFGKNPMRFTSRGALRDSSLGFDSLRLEQKDLADISGKGTLNLAPDIPSFSGDLAIANLQFPAAYSTYMANVLASSLLGDLATRGSVSGTVSVRDNDVGALHLLPKDLELKDNKGRLYLSKVNGDVSWAPADGSEARASRLSWSEGGAFGLSGGAATLDFVAHGMNFALTRPAKLPVFDGAIGIEEFAMGNLGADDMEVAFKGNVEPISMQRLAKAFGWPEFSGKLAASIPGVTLKNNVLTFAGNVESEVFGGKIVGSNIRLQDPLGNFPQLFADVRARDLDLGEVTNTFEVGSITGKLEADVLGLQLFGWSPVAFNARLATPKGDKSRHRISAKAVSSLSNVGGGGGGVVQALQSGVLKFFDEYSYDELGITCKLRDDICEMSGVEKAGIGYYIVKGAGIPRIDIVGNAGRVRWSQLVSSIATTNYGGASTN